MDVNLSTRSGFTRSLSVHSMYDFYQTRLSCTLHNLDNIPTRCTLLDVGGPSYCYHSLSVNVSADGSRTTRTLRQLNTQIFEGGGGIRSRWQANILIHAGIGAVDTKSASRCILLYLSSFIDTRAAPHATNLWERSLLSRVAGDCMRTNDPVTAFRLQRTSRSKCLAGLIR